MSEAEKREGAPRLAEERRAEARRLAEDLLGFLDESPCAFHAVASLETRLLAAGFAKIDEKGRFAVNPGGRYYLTRNDSALLAFVAGAGRPSTAGFRIVGAHTDSPALKLKPNPEIAADGQLRLGVEIYGGPILATWLDRDLGICGRVVIAREDGRLETRLFKSARPFVCLPGLAVHMNRQVNDEGLKVNPQTELTPILGAIAEGLPEKGAVRSIVAKELGIAVESIVGYDLFLFDGQRASFGGAADELFRSGRIDNLSSCHAAVTALIATGKKSPVTATQVAVLYDNEEVGSQSNQGALSNFLPAALERIATAFGDDREGYLMALARSLLVSADNAHARHPGYPAKSEPQHAPLLNGGPVVKAHASRAYATDGYSAAVFEMACQKAGVPSQNFVNRSDVKSGSTIGSMTAAQLGISTVDVGSPQLAMHSIRETAGTYDHYYMTEALGAFLS
ncbi:MAG: M18 family aminopeptidase [Pseudomonadota bacterium]